jgi:hypothetical protein
MSRSVLVMALRLFFGALRPELEYVVDIESIILMARIILRIISGLGAVNIYEYSYVEVFLVTGQKIFGVLNRILISEVFLSRGILIPRFDCTVILTVHPFGRKG